MAYWYTSTSTQLWQKRWTRRTSQRDGWKGRVCKEGGMGYRKEKSLHSGSSASAQQCTHMTTLPYAFHVFSDESLSKHKVICIPLEVDALKRKFKGSFHGCLTSLEVEAGMYRSLPLCTLCLWRSLGNFYSHCIIIEDWHSCSMSAGLPPHCNSKADSIITEAAPPLSQQQCCFCWSAGVEFEHFWIGWIFVWFEHT